MADNERDKNDVGSRTRSNECPSRLRRLDRGTSRARRASCSSRLSTLEETILDARLDQRRRPWEDETRTLVSFLLVDDLTLTVSVHSAGRVSPAHKIDDIHTRQGLSGCPAMQVRSCPTLASRLPTRPGRRLRSVALSTRGSVAPSSPPKSRYPLTPAPVPPSRSLAPSQGLSRCSHWSPYAYARVAVTKDLLHACIGHVGRPFALSSSPPAASL